MSVMRTRAAVDLKANGKELRIILRGTIIVYKNEHGAGYKRRTGCRYEMRDRDEEAWICDQSESLIFPLTGNYGGEEASAWRQARCS